MSSAAKANINITPLIDIVLVLLIVFIVLVGVDKGYTPKLPVVGPALPTEGVDPLMLAAGADGSLRLAGQAIGDVELETSLRAALAERAPGDRRLVLKVEGDGRFQIAVDLLARIHRMDPQLPVLLR